MLKRPHYIIYSQKLRSNMPCLLMNPFVLWESSCMESPMTSHRNCWRRTWIKSVCRDESHPIGLRRCWRREMANALFHLCADSWVVALWGWWQQWKQSNWQPRGKPIWVATVWRHHCLAGKMLPRMKAKVNEFNKLFFCGHFMNIWQRCSID